MIAGVVGGCACGMVSWLSYAAQFPGGLAPSVFVKNTGEVALFLLKLNGLSLYVMFT